MCTGSKKKWSNVHACTSSVRWNICCIQADSQMHRFLEQLDWYCGHADVRRRVLHPLRIGFWSENSNRLVVGSTRGLQSFVALHAVVEARCHPMEAEKWVVHKLGSSPFSRLGGVSGLDVTIHLSYRQYLIERVLARRSLHTIADVPSRTLNPMSSQSAGQSA